MPDEARADSEMKKLLAVAGILTLWWADGLLAQDSVTIPAFNQVSEIGLAPAGKVTTWYVEFRRDGSAQITLGSNFSARAPKKTFSFREIYDQVASLSLNRNVMEQNLQRQTTAFDLYYMIGDRSDSISFFLEDKATIKRLLTAARDKVTFHTPQGKSYFEGLAKEHHLIPSWAE